MLLLPHAPFVSLDNREMNFICAMLLKRCCDDALSISVRATCVRVCSVN